MNARILEVFPHCIGPLDVAPLIPERLLGMAESDLGDIPMGGHARVRDCFSISGVDSDHLVLRAGALRPDHVGSGMRSGKITIEGNCGNFAGHGMRGGKISVTGNTGDYAGCEMRGGMVDIAGDAGSFTGAALPGSMQGMRGGFVVVHGNAGDRTGDRMRRGLILVAGNTGSYCGSRMLAGTIVVKGRVGPMPGLGLRRGTLIFDHIPPEMPAAFQDSGLHRLLILRLMEKELQRLGAPFSGFQPFAGEVRRYCGDLGTGGFGEILVPAERQSM